MRIFSKYLPLAIGTCAGSGFCGGAPGTLGALLGTAAYPLTFRRMGIATFSVCYILSLLFAVWICGRCGEILKETDPPAVNLDEYIAMPLCFWPVEHFLGPMPLPLWAFLLLGFALFRLFDIRKPPPIGLLQKLPGGWGIVLDDSAAALATALCLWLAVAFLGLPSAHLAIGGG